MSVGDTPRWSTDEGDSSVVEAWCKADHAIAVLPADHDVIESTRSLRGLIAASLARRPARDDRDLLNAFGALGQVTARGRGSPTLAACSVDSLVGALPSTGPGAPFAMAARAAMVESYVFARVAEVRVEALRAWDYPATVVRLDATSIAIAAGYPASEDGLDDWASRVAQRAAMSGARRAVVSGSERAVEPVQAALEVAGVETVLAPSPGSLKAPPPPLR
jgi:hypothetical protein